MVSELVWRFNQGAFTSDQKKKSVTVSFQKLIFFASNYGCCISTNTMPLCSQNPSNPTPENPSLANFAHALTCRQQQDLRRCVSPHAKCVRHFLISIFTDVMFSGGRMVNPYNFQPDPMRSNLCNSFSSKFLFQFQQFFYISEVSQGLQVKSEHILEN